MGQITNRKGARMKIEVTYNGAEVEAMVMAAHVARFGAAPEGKKWRIKYSYSGQFEVTAVDANETEAASE
jgi:hypothetical protein